MPITWPDWTYLTRAAQPGVDTVKGEWRDALSLHQSALRPVAESGGFGLTFDGVTDQTAQVQELLDSYGSLRIVAPQGGSLRIDGDVVVRGGQLLDLSACPLVRGANGRISIAGDLSTTTFTLSSNVAAGATVLPVAEDPTGRIVIGDIVAVDGTDLAKVVAFTATSITLDRSVRRAYASGASVTRVLPAVGGVVIGARSDRSIATPVVPAYEMRWAYESAIIASVRVGQEGSVAAVKVLGCLACLVHMPVINGGVVTGINIEASRGVVVSGARLEETPEGIKLVRATETLILGANISTCERGVVVFGTGNVDVHAVALNANSVQQAVDVEGGSGVFLSGLNASAGDAALRIATPAWRVSLLASRVREGHAVRLISGSGAGGEVFVDGLVHEGSGAYAVKDETVSGSAFSKVHLGSILQHSGVAGRVSPGASTIAGAPSGLPDPASLPGGVLRSNGTTYALDALFIDTTPAKVTVSTSATLNGENVWISGGARALRLTIVEIANAGNAATVSIDPSAPDGSMWRLVRASGSTGAITIEAPAGATFQNGEASATLDGDVAIVEKVSSTLFRLYGQTSLGVRLPANTSFAGGQIDFGGGSIWNGVPREVSLTANYTLRPSDSGTVFVCTSAITLTVPSGWVGRVLVLNAPSSSGSVDIGGVRASNVPLQPGQGAVIAGYAAGIREVNVYTPTAIA